MHCHLGGFDFSDDFVVYSWLLCKKIEKELQSYLPKSRRNNEYCHDLPDNKTLFGKSYPLIDQLKTLSNKHEYDTIIECLYKELFKAYAQVYPGKDVNKLTNHPQGNNVGYNHSSLRYSWINFLPCMFNVRDVREFSSEEERIKHLEGDKTAGKIVSYSWELRSHNGTTNFTKVKNWLLLFMGITYYIENNKKAIINNEKISINDILKFAYPKKSTKLMEYFHKRQELFKNDEKENSEYAVQAKRGIKQQPIKQLI